jgi:hypothetical protein
LPRTSSLANKSEYTSSDGLIKLSLSHAYGRRNRRVLRVDHRKIAADAFRPVENTSVSMSNYIVFDVPVYGYTNAQQLEVYAGFKALFTATSDAVITKLLGGES